MCCCMKREYERNPGNPKRQDNRKVSLWSGMSSIQQMLRHQNFFGTTDKSHPSRVLGNFPVVLVQNPWVQATIEAMGVQITII